MRRNLFLASLAVAGFAALVACSGSNSQGDEEEKSKPPPQQFGGCIGPLCVDINFDGGGAPGPATDGGGGTTDGGAPAEACDIANQDYAEDLKAAIENGYAKACNTGCAATECCYLGLSCLEKK